RTQTTHVPSTTGQNRGSHKKRGSHRGSALEEWARYALFASLLLKTTGTRLSCVLMPNGRNWAAVSPPCGDDRVLATSLTRCRRTRLPCSIVSSAGNQKGDPLRSAP